MNYTKEEQELFAEYGVLTEDGGLKPWEELDEELQKDIRSITYPDLYDYYADIVKAIEEKEGERLMLCLSLTHNYIHIAPALQVLNRLKAEDGYEYRSISVSKKERGRIIPSPRDRKKFIAYIKQCSLYLSSHLTVGLYDSKEEAKAALDDAFNHGLF